MDANLIARELEMTLLAKLLEGTHVNASSNLTMPVAALLHLLRAYLGPEVHLPDVRAAAHLSPVLTWTPYARSFTVAGVSSPDGVRLSVHKWDPCAASRASFARRLREHADRPRPPIAATTFPGGPLGTRPVTFTVRNEGYGTQADVQVTGVEAPDWVCTQVSGLTVTLTACPARGGVYRGQVTVHTTANALVLPVSTESAAFALPTRDELTLDEALPDHPDLDRAASERLLEAHLTRLHFKRLPGGLFLRRGLHVPEARVQDWWLTEAQLLSGSLPADGYPGTFTLYADAGGKLDKYAVEVTSSHGQLGGELGDLFDLLEVQAGQRLSLAPYRGGYKASLSPAEPWRTAEGHTFWLQGPREAVLAEPAVIEALIRRCDDRNITLNVLLCGEGEVHPDLVRQHRSGRLTLRWAASPLPYRLIACGERAVAYVPPHGPAQLPAAAPQALWEAAAPLQGRDYREQAWQRGRGGEGTSDGSLLNLDLSVAMARLADALRPVPPESAAAGPVPVTPAQRERLLGDLPRGARALGVYRRPVLAASLLESLGLTAAQVNAYGNGVRVTRGGYLVVRPQDLGGQRERCRYVGTLYGGVIHHSQLRKLVEAYQGSPLEPMSFLVASLEVMGWGGNGYRRPLQDWEPVRRELTPFAAEVLAHLGNREAALDWLRRNVAASEDQLARALEKAGALVPTVQAKEPRTLPNRPVSVRKKVSPVAPKAGRPVQGAPPPTPATAPRPTLTFHPLTQLETVLPDPRTSSALKVQEAVVELVAAEGPMSATWLVRRYASLARLNPRQVDRPVRQVASLAAMVGLVSEAAQPCGHVEYALARQAARVRERGARQAEDIPLSEWCALLKTLGLSSAACNEKQAYEAAAEAYGFGTSAAVARPLIGLAWRTVRAGSSAPRPAGPGSSPGGHHVPYSSTRKA